jgi:hypothetical protein
MRQKFGQSTGLNPSGKMQGLGSDPNYKPGGESASSALDFDQLADVSQKALSFFQTSIAALGEQVSKVCDFVV